MNRLLRHGSAYALGSAAQMAAAAVVVPVVTRLLTPREYGLVGLVLAFQVFLGHVSTLGLPMSITRWFFGRTQGEAPDAAEGPDAARRLTVSATLVALCMTLLAAATFPIWQGLVAPADRSVLLLGFPLALATGIFGASQGLIQAQQQVRLFVGAALAASVGAQVSGVTLAILIAPTATSYLTGFLVGLSLAAGLGLIRSGAVGTGVRPAPRALLLAALAKGFPALPLIMGVAVIALGDRVVIQLLEGTEAVGRYQVAYALGAVALVLLSAFQSAWLPATFSAADDERWALLSASSTKVVRLAAIVAGLIAVTAPLGLAVLAPAEYDPQSLVPVTALVAAAALPWALYLPFFQVLLWEHHTRPMIWIAPLAAALNVALVVLLLPAIGLPGAAAATVAAFALQAVLTWAAARRVAAIHWDARALWRSLLGGTLLIGIGALIPASPIGVGVRAVLAVALASSLWLELPRRSSLQPAPT